MKNLAGNGGCGGMVSIMIIGVIVTAWYVLGA